MASISQPFDEAVFEIFVDEYLKVFKRSPDKRFFVRKNDKTIFNNRQKANVEPLEDQYNAFVNANRAEDAKKFLQNSLRKYFNDREIFNKKGAKTNRANKKRSSQKVSEKHMQEEQPTPMEKMLRDSTPLANQPRGESSTKQAGGRPKTGLTPPSEAPSTAKAQPKGNVQRRVAEIESKIAGRPETGLTPEAQDIASRLPPGGFKTTPARLAELEMTPIPQAASTGTPAPRATKRKQLLNSDEVRTNMLPSDTASTIPAPSSVETPPTVEPQANLAGAFSAAAQESKFGEEVSPIAMSQTPEKVTKTLMKRFQEFFGNLSPQAESAVLDSTIEPSGLLTPVTPGPGRDAVSVRVANAAINRYNAALTARKTAEAAQRRAETIRKQVSQGVREGAQASKEADPSARENIVRSLEREIEKAEEQQKVIEELQSKLDIGNEGGGGGGDGQDAGGGEGGGQDAGGGIGGGQDGGGGGGGDMPPPAYAEGVREEAPPAEQIDAAEKTLPARELITRALTGTVDEDSSFTTKTLMNLVDAGKAPDTIDSNNLPSFLAKSEDPSLLDLIQPIYRGRMVQYFDSAKNIKDKVSFSEFIARTEPGDTPIFKVNVQDDDEVLFELEENQNFASRWQMYTPDEMKEMTEYANARYEVKPWMKDMRYQSWRDMTGSLSESEKQMWDEWSRRIISERARREFEAKEAAKEAGEDYTPLRPNVKPRTIDVSNEDMDYAEAQARQGVTLAEFAKNVDAQMKSRMDAFEKYYKMRNLVKEYQTQFKRVQELQKQVQEQARAEYAAPEAKEDGLNPQEELDLATTKLKETESALTYYCQNEDIGNSLNELRALQTNKAFFDDNGSGLQFAADALATRTNQQTVADFLRIPNNEENMDVIVEENEGDYLSSLEKSIKDLKDLNLNLEGKAASIEAELRNLQIQQLENAKLRYLKAARELRARKLTLEKAKNKVTLDERNAKIQAAKDTLEEWKNMTRNEIYSKVIDKQPIPDALKAKYTLLSAQVQLNQDEGLHEPENVAGGAEGGEGMDWFTNFRTGLIGSFIGSLGAHEIMGALDPDNAIPHVPRLAIEGGIAGIGATYATAGITGGTDAMAAVTSAELGPAAVGFATYYEVQDAVDRPLTDALLKAGASEAAATAVGDVGSNAAAGAAAALATEGTAAGIAAATGAGAEAGAEAGSVFGPIGTLAGIGLGALAGAIFGFGQWLIGRAERAGGDGTMYDPKSHPYGTFGYLPNYNMGSPETYANWLNKTFPEGVRDGKKLQSYDTEDNRKRYEAWVKSLYDQHQDDIKAAAQARALYSVPVYEGLDAPTQKEMIQKTGQGIAPGEAAGFDNVPSRDMARSSPLDRVRMRASKQPRMKSLFSKENISYHGFTGWLRKNGGAWLKTHAPKVLEATMIALDQHGYGQANEAMTGTAKIVQQYVRTGMKHLGAIRATAKYLGIPDERVKQMVNIAKGARSSANLVMKASKGKEKYVMQQSNYEPTSDEETIAGRLMNLVTEEQIDTSQYRHAYNKLATEPITGQMQQVVSHLLKQFPTILVKPSGVTTMNDVQDMVVTAAASFMTPLYKGSPTHEMTAGKKRKRDDDCVCRLLQQIVDNQNKMISMQQAKDKTQDPVNLQQIQEQLPIEDIASPPIKKRRITPGREGGLPTALLRANAGFRFSQSQIDASVSIHRNGLSFAADLNQTGLRLRV